MQVNARELATWSFLMASAHGAGLMILPLVIGDTHTAAHGHHVAAASMIGLAGMEWSGVLATLVHTAGYLLVTGLIAVIVYERVGTRFLRTAWVNLDLIWAVVLIATGLATVF
jgi:hypothetical protein